MKTVKLVLVLLITIPGGVEGPFAVVLANEHKGRPTDPSAPLRMLKEGEYGPGTDELLGTVSEVVDGNTILVKTREGEEYKVVMHGIDSPEPGQRYADQSKELLKKLLLKKDVTITLHSRDRHGNRIGTIAVEGSPDPRHELLKSGLAWPAERHNEPELEALKEEARQKNIGIWEEENPTPPWTFRRQQSMMDAKSS